MFIEIPGPTVKCSECESTLYETVTRGSGRNAITFQRCRSCGHEGKHRWVYPEAHQNEIMSKLEKAWQRSSEPEEVKF